MKVKRYPVRRQLHALRESEVVPTTSILVVELPDDRIEKKLTELPDGTLSVKMSLWNPDGPAYQMHFLVSLELFRQQPQVLLWHYQRAAERLALAWVYKEPAHVEDQHG